VQEWRQTLGLRSGVLPAVEQVGMAFLFGVIPGAALRGVHEAGARLAQGADQAWAERKASHGILS
jgi:hypothetical protein